MSTKETFGLRERAAYDKPVLRQYGSVEKITKGGGPGVSLDASFPIGTPVDQLTFS